MKSIFVILLWLISYCYAATKIPEIEQKFLIANKFYETGEYNQAIKTYEQILNDYNIQSAEIYYNLGNAYYRANQIGKAILNYTRAIKLNPRDEDSRYNLQYLKQIIKDISPENIFLKLYHILKLKELNLILTITNIALFTSLGIYITKKFSKVFKQLSITFGILFTIFFLWTISRIAAENKIYAIVIVPNATIRSGPGDEYTIGVTVPEGKEVQILSEQENYYAVCLQIAGEKGSEGKYKGWIKKSDIEKI